MYSDGSTSPVLMCVALPYSGNSDGGAGVLAHAVACVGVTSPPELPCSQNAMSSITLHSVSKLRLPLSIRAYFDHYAELYLWK
jgi:hypothetical protein